jgi:hypothetical protein
MEVSAGDKLRQNETRKRFQTEEQGLDGVLNKIKCKIHVKEKIANVGNVHALNNMSLLVNC